MRDLGGEGDEVPGLLTPVHDMDERPAAARVKRLEQFSPVPVSATTGRRSRIAQKAVYGLTLSDFKLVSIAPCRSSVEARSQSITPGLNVRRSAHMPFELPPALVRAAMKGQTRFWEEAAVAP